jgi:hypothetical protein
MGNRRMTRLTNAFSKKAANHAHMMAIYFMHYNFVRIHQTLKITPAMAAGITGKLLGNGRYSCRLGRMGNGQMNRQNYWTSDRTAKVRRLIQSLYDVVRELENEFVDEKRKFTLDGHLVGSIGEVVAAYSFGRTLLPASEKTHDAKKDRKMIQIKLTGGNKSVALSSKPDHLIVLQLAEIKVRTCL